MPLVFEVTGTSMSARPMSFWLFISTPRSMGRTVQPAGVRHMSNRFAVPVSTSCVRPAMKMGAVATRVLLALPSACTESLKTPVGSTAYPRGTRRSSRRLGSIKDAGGDPAPSAMPSEMSVLSCTTPITRSSDARLRSVTRRFNAARSARARVT